jgi:hypothetical protein
VLAKSSRVTKQGNTPFEFGPFKFTSHTLMRCVLVFLQQLGLLGGVDMLLKAMYRGSSPFITMFFSFQFCVLIEVVVIHKKIELNLIMDN